MLTTPAEIARRALADHLAARPSAELLKRYANRRDPEAFAGLVQQFGPMVLGVCRRVLGASADVDDAFQAVFLSLARQADSFRDAQALPAWLHRVSLRVSHKALARRAPASAPTEAVADPADPYADVMWKDVRRVLDEELDALPEKYRGPVVLCWLDGLTQDEAAGRLGVSLATLKRRLDVGRELLRTRLVRRGLAPVLAAAAVADPTSLRAVVPESLKVLAVELGVGGAVPAGVAGLEVLVSATAPTRRVVLVALLGAGMIAAGVMTAAALVPPAPPEPPPVPAPEVAVRPNPILELAPAPRPAPAKSRLVPRTRMTGHVRGTELWWSPDGALLAAITSDPKGENERITVWAVETFAVRAELGKYAKGDGIRALAFGPDGATIAAGHESGTIRFWDIATAKEKEPIRELKGAVSSLAWSSDGTALAFQAGRALTIWDARVKKARGAPVELTDTVTALEFSPDNRSLAVLTRESGKDRGEHQVTMSVWDVATGQPRPGVRYELATKYGQGVHDGLLGELYRTYRAVAWSGDSRFVTVACSHLPAQELVTIDAATGKVHEHRRFERNTRVDLSGLVRLGPEGRVLTHAVWKRHREEVSKEQVVLQLIDARTGEELTTFDTADGLVMGARFSPDGKTLACAHRARAKNMWGIQTDNLTEIRLLDTDRGTNRQATFATATTGAEIASMGWTEKGALAHLSRDMGLAVWNPTTGERLMHAPYPRPGVSWSICAPSPDGKYAALTTYSVPIVDGTPKTEYGTEVIVWDIAANRPHVTFKGHEKGSHSVMWSRDGRTLASVEKGAILVWNVGTQKLRAKLPATVEYSTAWAISPDGKTVIAGAPFVPPKPREPGTVSNPEWASPPRITPVTLWDVDTGKQKRLPVEAVSLTWSPDGKFIAYTDEEDAVRLWDVAAGCEYVKLDTPARWHNWGGPALAFSPDGSALAFVRRIEIEDGKKPNHPIQLWDVAAKRFREPLAGHYDVRSLAWSTDGKTLASHSRHEVMLWDVGEASQKK